MVISKASALYAVAQITREEDSCPHACPQQFTGYLLLLLLHNIHPMQTQMAYSLGSAHCSPPECTTATVIPVPATFNPHTNSLLVFEDRDCCRLLHWLKDYHLSKGLC